MAAEYTKFSIDDIEKFLKRGFRAMRPRKGEQREVYFDLKLSSKAFIRVWTSIYPGEELVRSKELRPVRVQLLGGPILSKGRPLTRGKAPIVKRTQNWRSTLQNRIQDFIELFEGGTYDRYHDDDDEDEAAAPPPMQVAEPLPQPAPDEAEEEESGEPPAGDEPKRPKFTGPPITGPQLSFVMKLVGHLTKQGKMAGIANDYGFDPGPITEEAVKATLSKATASKFIDSAKRELGWDSGGGGGGYGRSRYRRYAGEDESFENEVEETTYNYDRSQSA